MPNRRPRAREFGLRLGELSPGPHNAITDVDGVLVGHSTVSFGSGPLKPGRGPARTGVTAVMPHGGNCFLEKLEAAAYVINGFGKSIGLPQLQELGQLESPILLTGTLNAPKVADALISYMVAETRAIGIDMSTVNVVVGECNDGYLNDGQGRHVQAEHVLEAIKAAKSGPVGEGAVGAGTGMVAFGFKGGIGTASRILPEALGGFTVGILVLSNFGARRHLMVGGVPIGQELAEYPEKRPGDGSIMVILATDAPLKSRQLQRLLKRVPFGLARTGSIASNGSGDFAIGFSTALGHSQQGEVLDLQNQSLTENGQLMTGLFLATVEATEEAVLNSLFAATTTKGRDDNLVPELPLDEVRSLLNKYGRL